MGNVSARAVEVVKELHNTSTSIIQHFSITNTNTTCEYIKYKSSTSVVEVVKRMYRCWDGDVIGSERA